MRLHSEEIADELSQTSLAVSDSKLALFLCERNLRCLLEVY